MATIDKLDEMHMLLLLSSVRLMKVRRKNKKTWIHESARRRKKKTGIRTDVGNRNGEPTRTADFILTLFFWGGGAGTFRVLLHEAKCN